MSAAVRQHFPLLVALGLVGFHGDNPRAPRFPHLWLLKQITMKPPKRAGRPRIFSDDERKARQRARERRYRNPTAKDKAA